MLARSIGWPEIGKFSTARWVCARHLARAGTRTSPIESCSMRKSLSVISVDPLLPRWVRLPSDSLTQRLTRRRPAGAPAGLGRRARGRRSSGCGWPPPTAGSRWRSCATAPSSPTGPVPRASCPRSPATCRLTAASTPQRCRVAGRRRRAAASPTSRCSAGPSARATGGCRAGPRRSRCSAASTSTCARREFAAHDTYLTVVAVFGGVVDRGARRGRGAHDRHGDLRRQDGQGAGGAARARRCCTSTARPSSAGSRPS